MLTSITAYPPLRAPFTITGVLKYGPGLRAAVWLCPDLSRYYLSLLPKSWPASGQRHDTHVTVVRIGKEIPPDLTAWGKHEGREVEVEYHGIVRWDHRYYWLDAWSKTIGDIREELGLPRYREGFTRYHLTIGNRKLR